MPNPFVHLELATDDVAKAKAFYGGLFGWKLTDTPMDYTLFDTGTPPGGGIFKRPPEVPACWSVYVGVPDIAATLKKARRLGAQVVRDRTLISPEHGHFAVLQDPGGAVLCLHEAPTGHRPARKPRKARKAPAARKPARRVRRRR